MDLDRDSHRQVYDRERPVGEMLGVENQEVRAPAFVVPSRDTQEIPRSFRGVRSARREATLEQRSLRARVVERMRAVLMIEARIAGAPCARRGVRIETGEEAIPVGLRVVAVVLPRQPADVWVHLLYSIGRRRALRKIHREPRDVTRTR